jgi:hypothetical protein
LELASEDDIEIEVNYKDMKIQFNTGKVYDLTPDCIQDPAKVKAAEGAKQA